MILSRKEEITWLEAVGEEGMLHSNLSSLPILYEEGEEGDPPPPMPEVEAEGAGAAVDEKPKVNALANGDCILESTVKSEVPSVAEPFTDAPSPTPPPLDAKEVVSSPLPAGSPIVSSDDTEVSGNLFSPLSHLSTVGSDRTTLDEEPLADRSPTFTEDCTTLLDEPTIKVELEETKPAPTSTSTSESEPETSDPWPDTPGQPPKARISLSSLLRQADDLFERFPPSHPKLDLNKIMGPRSTIFTWTESFSLPNDELEQYVKTPHLVVLPYVDPVEEAMMKEKQAREIETMKAERRWKLKKGLFSRASMQRKTVFAGAVLALGIAIAVYGARVPGDSGRGHYRSDWKKLLRYIGGLLLAGGDKFVGRLLGH
jgi:hypothetical protein